MTAPDTLPALLNLIRAAPGPSRELDARIEVAMLGQTDRFHARWLPSGWIYEGDTEGRPAILATSSLDAAVGLVERMLPGWGWHCDTFDDHCRAGLAWGPLEVEVTCRPPGNVPLALMEALIRALIAMEAKPKT